MTNRQLIAVLCAAIALLVYLSGAVAVRRAMTAAGIADPALLADGMLAAGAAGAAGGLAMLVLFLLLDRWLLRPAAVLGRQARRLAQSRLADHAIEAPPHHRLGPLPDATVALAQSLREARRDMVRAMETATTEVARQKEWLEAILLDFSDGVVVCGPNHQILLYNPNAARLLQSPESLGLGRSLLNLLTREPLLHALERLEYRRAEGVAAADLVSPFVCATVDSRAMLHGRMSLILGPVREVNGYAVTLTDIRAEIADLTRMNVLRRTLSTGLRGPAANLRAAAETLTGFPGMSPEQRAAFEQVILAEGTEIARQIEVLSSEYRGHELLRWPMGDIYGADLVNCVSRILREDCEIAVIAVGIPQWLRGDSYSLVLLIKEVLLRVHRATGAATFDAETRLAPRQAYVDLSWAGPVIPVGAIESWMEDELDASFTHLTMRDVLDRHGSDLWCLERSDGRAVMRLPLPLAVTSEPVAPPAPLPPRPEFYDFGLTDAQSLPASLAERRLRDLDYVVFDTETTGLKPSDGDEIISLAGIRVVNGRILSGERFERLINPQRKIPRSSIRFHGITDDMVADRPPIEVVLPQFKTFVGDAVLVAHNAAFDIAFLKMKETASGVAFRNPVIDTLLLSVLVDGDEAAHSLDAVLGRFGISVPNRHTAIGDSMATAELFVRLIERLESQGVHTLAQVMAASNMAAEMRHAGASF
ncbi:PAS domain-containing protein [Magnetospirillum sp. SS-4]|uniref:3'-5' exonuclease n=1 Tax=Magnetospirillum sp. SS-4 TaxID=2681465 RepID=UPI00137DC75B|nr:PAS domain-containing protein [Magnetospirillum sp. SS-4]CAA7612843.1 putative PAS/PAC sensor protein [Magnetospirillum sp. SS-4]